MKTNNRIYIFKLNWNKDRHLILMRSISLFFSLTLIVNCCIFSLSERISVCINSVWWFSSSRRNWITCNYTCPVSNFHAAIQNLLFIVLFQCFSVDSPGFPRSSSAFWTCFPSCGSPNWSGSPPCAFPPTPCESRRTPFAYSDNPLAIGTTIDARLVSAAAEHHRSFPDRWRCSAHR